MTKRYTNEDVERLVKSVEDIEDAFYRPISLVSAVHKGSIYHKNLQAALAPFRPDPEEELIEAMAKADFSAWVLPGSVITTWDQLAESGRDAYRRGARAVLALIKERGLPQ